MKIRSMIMCAIFSAVLSAQAVENTAPITATKEFNSSQVADIQEIIANYMVSHPRILQKSSNALRAELLREKNQQAIKLIEKNKEDLFENAMTPVMGNANADITVVEFLDYQCGHCKKASQMVEDYAKSNPNIRVLVVDFPIFGSQSRLAAKVALYAKEQGHYPAFHHALMNYSGRLNRETIMKLAVEAGMNEDKVRKYLEDQANKLEEYIASRESLAQSLGLIGTPAFIIANPKKDLYVFEAKNIDKDTLKSSILQVK